MSVINDGPWARLLLTSSSITEAATATDSIKLPQANCEPNMGYFSQTAPDACKLCDTISCMMGPIDPNTAIRGRRETVVALSTVLWLRSPSMVKDVTTTVELASPAKYLKMVQLARPVAKPMLRQQMTIDQRPRSVTCRLPTLSAMYPQNIPVMPPSAYAESNMLRR